MMTNEEYFNKESEYDDFMTATVKQGNRIIESIEEHFHTKMFFGCGIDGANAFVMWDKATREQIVVQIGIGYKKNPTMLYVLLKKLEEGKQFPKTLFVYDKELLALSKEIVERATELNYVYKLRG